MAEEPQSRNNRSSKRLRGHDWFELRKRILERDNHQCRNYGSKSNLVVHHIVPIKSTGTNRLSNLATLCRKYHRQAHNEWVRDSGKQVTDSSRYLLTVDELRQVLQMATHPLERATITTLAKTGIGVGELCNLTVDDLQLPSAPLGRISDEIPDNVPLIRIRYGGNLPYNNRRERKGTTFIPVDRELARVLKRWLAVRPDPHDGTSLVPFHARPVGEPNYTSDSSKRSRNPRRETRSLRKGLGDGQFDAIFAPIFL